MHVLLVCGLHNLGHRGDKLTPPWTATTFASCWHSAKDQYSQQKDAAVSAAAAGLLAILRAQADRVSCAQNKPVTVCATKCDCQQVHTTYTNVTMNRQQVVHQDINEYQHVCMKYMPLVLDYLATGEALCMNSDRRAASASCALSINSQLSQAIYQVLDGPLPHPCRPI